MPFVQAKCPECGGMLAVDDSKKAAVCQFCGEAFIVQEAINNYNTYNTTNNTYNTDNRTTHNYSDGAIVNVYEDINKDFVIEAGVLKEYHGASVDVVIPDGVIELGQKCFEGLKIKSVVIPDSVTNIGENAFQFCTNLNSVYINDLSAWCSIKFCSSSSNPLWLAKNLYLNGELVTNLVVPDDVTSIGNYAFCSCNFVSITIPDSITSIGLYAFWGCKNLSSITIPDSVTTIGDSAFSYCDNLEFVIFGKNVTSIGKCVFSRCKHLISIEIEEDNLNFSSQDGVLFNKDKTLLIKFPADKLGTEYKIPRSVTKIGSYAFEECENLTSITIPYSVTSIDEWAFAFCRTINSVTVGHCVTDIGDNAFFGCSNLNSVAFGNSVTNIGFWSFAGCQSLKNVEISDCLFEKFKKSFPDGLYEQILKQKEEEIKRKSEEEKLRLEQHMADYRSKNLCQHCGGTFKGLFSSKCSSCGKPKDY